VEGESYVNHQGVFVFLVDKVEKKPWQIKPNSIVTRKRNRGSLYHFPEFLKRHRVEKEKKKNITASYL
jgi:hypothetical protein